MALVREQVSRGAAMFCSGPSLSLMRSPSCRPQDYKNDLYFSPRELDEKVAKLHIPHSEQSSQPLNRKAVSRGVKVESLFGWWHSRL